jgi:excisionase family DNA binding protein
MSKPIYLTTSEIAGRLGVSSQTIINWCDTGALPCVRFRAGGPRKIKPEILKAYLDSNGIDDHELHKWLSGLMQVTSTPSEALKLQINDLAEKLSRTYQVYDSSTIGHIPDIDVVKANYHIELENSATQLLAALKEAGLC